MSPNDQRPETKMDRRSAMALAAGAVAAGGVILLSSPGTAAAADTVQKQTPKEGEPTAVGYPCIVRKRDIDAATKAQVKKDGVAGTLNKESVEARILHGSGLTYNSADGLYYWYSNYNSSDFCDTSYIWHSGRVYAYQFIGVCTNTGLNAFLIGVTD